MSQMKWVCATGCLSTDVLRLMGLRLARGFLWACNQLGGHSPAKVHQFSNAWLEQQSLSLFLSPSLLLTTDNSRVTDPVDPNNNSSAWRGWNKREDDPLASLGTRPAEARLKSWVTSVPAHHYPQLC